MTIRRIYTGDNLAVMQGMDAASVDLIYLDPPFNSNRDYAAPVTLRESDYEGQIAEFRDTWEYTDKDAEWRWVIAREEPAVDAVIEAAARAHSFRMGGYLCMMAARILEMRRLMKPSATVYLHCDPTASHYLKAMMDAVFGKAQFRNEIVWGYPASPSAAKRDFPRKHDIILRYSRTNEWTFNADSVRIPYAESSKERIKYAANASKVMIGQEIKLQGGGKIPPSAWLDIQQTYRYRKERVGYPTQKPLALLERIIKASSNPGDLVLDPFAGCATACVAAERLGRQWIGIDVSDMASKLVIERLEREYNAGGLPAFSEAGNPFHPDMVERIAIRGRAKPNEYCAGAPNCIGIRAGDAPPASGGFPNTRLRLTTSNPVPKAGRTNSQTFSCFAGDATESRGRGRCAT